MDQFERGKILLSGVDILVIDEADRMLDMGFIPDVEKICSKINPKRQTLLFSATMPPPIKKLADRFMKEPRTIEVSRPATTNASIAQSLVETSARGKRDTLRTLLRGDEITSAIVFCNRKRDVKVLAESLGRYNFRVGQIHGDMEQRDRLATLDKFKADEINILVASDVAARGLDIKGVSHIFNFDVPFHAEDYVHRIGRTGRGGRTGIAYTLATPEDAESIAEIEKLIGQKIERRRGAATADQADEPSAEAAPKTEEPKRRGRGRRPSREEPRQEAAAEPRREAAEEPQREVREEPRQPRRDQELAPEMPREHGRRDRNDRDRRNGRDDGRRDRRPRDDRDDGPTEVGFGREGPVPAFIHVSARV
jgi:superfamily II DNA/RNA helicase